MESDLNDRPEQSEVDWMGFLIAIEFVAQQRRMIRVRVQRFRLCLTAKTHSQHMSARINYASNGCRELRRLVHGPRRYRVAVDRVDRESE